jgi:hypothetical protein
MRRLQVSTLYVCKARGRSGSTVKQNYKIASRRSSGSTWREERHRENTVTAYCYNFLEQFRKEERRRE